MSALQTSLWFTRHVVHQTLSKCIQLQRRRFPCVVREVQLQLVSVRIRQLFEKTI